MSVFLRTISKNRQNWAPRAARVVRKPQKNQREQWEGAKSGLGQKVPPIFTEKWDPEGPQRDPQITPKSIKRPFGCSFFWVRPCSLAFCWFSAEFYAKYASKTGRPCDGICMIAQGCLKIRMSILYCKNQYETHFFQDWRSCKNVERSKTYEQNRWTKLRSQRNRLGVRFLLIFGQFCINFGGPNASRTRLQGSLIPSPKKWTQKNTVKETMPIIDPANCPPQGSSGG